MFGPADDKSPEPVPLPVPDDPDRVAGLPGAVLHAPAGGFPGGDGLDLDGIGWDGAPAWLTAIDLGSADEPPVEHEPWQQPPISADPHTTDTDPDPPPF